MKPRTNKQNIINSHLGKKQHKELCSSNALGTGDSKGVFRRAMMIAQLDKYEKNKKHKAQHGDVRHVKFDKDGKVISVEIIKNPNATN